MTERRIADIEVLRGFAVLMVLVEHIGFNLVFWHDWLEDFSIGYWRGAAGVDLFFAISGFVIARGLLPDLDACRTGQDRVRAITSFALRRFWRLQPAAWAWVVIPLALTLTFNDSKAFGTWGANLPSGVAALLAVSNLRTGIMHGSPGICFQYWSLSLEEQFYLFLPTMALLMRRQFLTLLLLALVGWQFFAPPTLICNLTRPGSIAAGVLLAIWSRHDAYPFTEPRFLARRAARWLFLVAMLAILGMLQSELLKPLYSVLFGLVAVFSAVLVHAASFDRGYIMPSGWIRPIFLWFGSRSYSMYLAHLTAFSVTRELYFRFRPLSFTHTSTEEIHYIIIGFGLTFVFAELTYRLIEAPGRRYGRRITRPAEKQAA
jgi:peptidoglycan/LPS O-acetylase OafA/YrhL